MNIKKKIVLKINIAYDKNKQKFKLDYQNIFTNETHRLLDYLDALEGYIEPNSQTGNGKTYGDFKTKSVDEKLVKAFIRAINSVTELNGDYNTAKNKEDLKKLCNACLHIQEHQYFDDRQFGEICSFHFFTLCDIVMPQKAQEQFIEKTNTMTGSARQIDTQVCEIVDNLFIKN